MRSTDDVRQVFELWAQGLSKNGIARETGVSRNQVARWLSDGLDKVLASPMRRRAAAHIEGKCELIQTVDRAAYAYLFGQYLGDGSIVRSRNVFRLFVATCDDYPNVRAECKAAIAAVMPGRSVGGTQATGCTNLWSYSKHWPCVFPQHGPGRKHERPLILRSWQERIIFESHPGLFLRGLIHSDGYRGMNPITRVTKSGVKQYQYPRYQFTNASGHIHGFFIEACRRLGIEWRWMKPHVISVAKRESVERLDAFVGPKS